MPILSNVNDVDDIEFSKDAEYYLASKIQSGYYRESFQERLRNWQFDSVAVSESFSSYKTRPGKKQIKLSPKMRTLKQVNWEEVVLRRKSTRHFSKGPLSFTKLSNLILLSCGLKEKGQWLKKPHDAHHWPKRALPSGGGLYPLEYYVLALDVKSLSPGLYHFDVLHGSLNLLNDSPEALKMDNDIWLQSQSIGRPAAMIFVTSVFDRTRVKYGKRALKLIYLEAGGVAAHMNLTATAMGIGFCIDGGGYEDKFEKILGVDGYTEGLVSQFVLGNLNR